MSLTAGAESKIAAQKGATMVEFALACVFLIFMLGAFFDIGLGLHNYTLLNRVTEESTRQVAVNFNTRPDCPAIRRYLEEIATPHLRDVLGADVKGEPEWCMRWHDSGEGGNFPVLRITGRFPISCYFLCSFFPDGWLLSSTTEIVIENSSARCAPEHEFGCSA